MFPRLLIVHLGRRMWVVPFLRCRTLPAPPIAVSPRGRFELYDGLAELNGWAPTVAVVTGGNLTAETIQRLTEMAEVS